MTELTYAYKYNYEGRVLVLLLASFAWACLGGLRLLGGTFVRFAGLTFFLASLQHLQACF